MDLSRFREALRQGCVDPWAVSVQWKDAPSPPQPPDLKGAAEATAKSQMGSQYTPYGSQVYSPDQNSPSGFASNITLAPQAQHALDSQMSLSQNMGDLAQSQLGAVNQQYSKPMDLSSVPQVADQAYKAMTSRLDPQWQHNEQMQKTELTNQGLVPGGEAYDNAMRTFNQGKNDAYQQANLGAISTMPQTYQMANSIYQQPLNQMNAIRTGAQIQNPTFQPPGAGTNYLGAAQSLGQYNQGLYGAQVGNINSQNQMLGQLGGSALGMYMMGNK